MKKEEGKEGEKGGGSEGEREKRELKNREGEEEGRRSLRNKRKRRWSRRSTQQPRLFGELVWKLRAATTPRLHPAAGLEHTPAGSHPFQISFP